jgi:UPF0755 protein
MSMCLGSGGVLADQFYLIAHEDRTGRSRLHPRATGIGLAASLLGELVLDNRLRINMKLQLDSTVSYAVQRFNVTTTSQDRDSPSRYNTYRWVGLPAGPIANPGEDALKAVMNPTPGKWLYFVTTNPSTGETKFAVDEAGHAANTREFQKWLQTH